MTANLFETFDRSQWRSRRAATPLTLDADDLDELRGLNEALDLEEVESVYLPLSRLLNLHVIAAQHRNEATATFLDRRGPASPYVVGIAGSVAVGKSTTARVLQALLARWPDHPQVDLVTTDGFLFPNAELEARGLLDRKGFPESYDQRRLLDVLRRVKAGDTGVTVPQYSHLTYDVLPESDDALIDGPDILIVEGLNVLQVSRASTDFVSDYFDVSIYVDAATEHIRNWYVERFKALRETAFKEPESFFRHFAALSDEQATEVAVSIWKDINEANLVANIAPTKDRASVLLHKGADHRVDEVRIRRV